jgi:hypothetical protein
MLQGQLLRSLPVFPWLKIGETSINDVRVPIQQLKTTYGGRLLLKDGASPETGGTFINLSAAVSGGLLGEPGLTMLTIDFDQQNKAQMAVFWVSKGWGDANIRPLVERVSARYANYANPVVISDPESEATDKTVLYDMGRFVAEIRVPQQGSYAFVTFTTKELLKKIRMMDGTYDLLKKYLEN